jgi:hypothetical protein
VFGGEIVAKVPLASGGGAQAEATGADEFMVGLEGDGELEFVARLRPLPVEKKLEELAHILGLPFGPGIILQLNVRSFAWNYGGIEPVCTASA